MLNSLLAKIFPLACDIRDANAVKETVNRMQDLTGSLPSVVVNNAAGNFISPTERLSSNAFKTIVDIVLLGTANVTLEIGKVRFQIDVSELEVLIGS